MVGKRLYVKLCNLAPSSLNQPEGTDLITKDARVTQRCLLEEIETRFDPKLLI